MTVRKGTTPKGAELSAEKNLWFETTALAELERLPTPAWEDMDALWKWLPLAFPATRRRILARCLELAFERGDSFSPKFVKRFAGHAVRELAVSANPRARVHDQEGMRAVARHLARNPQASLSELAAVAGGKKGSIRQWKGRRDFQAYLNDERFLFRIEQEKLARLGAERRKHLRRGRITSRSKIARRKML
jgi:hypothetical protein